MPVYLNAHLRRSGPRVPAGSTLNHSRHLPAVPRPVPMFPLIKVFYHGEQQIDYWEYLAAVFYVLLIYAYFARKRTLMKKAGPEYKYYIPAVMAKLFSTVFFTLFYFYYYQGGDSQAYYFSALAMRNLALEDPTEYISQMLGDNSYQAWSKYSLNTAKPYQFMFFDDRTFAVVRFVSIVTFFTFKSYLLANLLVATMSFFGVWACYRTFVSYFPQLSGKLAVGFLFMPSSVFWGSPILKDTITFTAVCWWVHAVDEVFFKRRNVVNKSITLVLAGVVMVMVKPYIFMVLMPATLLWLFYFRFVNLQNALVKFVLGPVTLGIFVATSLFILTKMGDSFDKFALDGALKSIEVTQKDLLRKESYGTNSFNVGEFDGTWFGLLTKFPIAVNASFFRPYIWECNNFAMVLSGLENTWVLSLTTLALLRAGPRFFFRCMGGIPILLMSMTFALLFAFTVGVSTPNFGALVRFKIPMVPFFISSMYIIVYMSKVKWALKNEHLPFDLREFRMGTAHVKNVVDMVTERKRAKLRRMRMARAA